MDYKRPDDAPASWAADTMRKHLMDIRIEVHGDFSGSPPTATGKLVDVTGDDLILDCGEGYRETVLYGRDITGITLLTEPIDHSDDLRG